MKRAIAVALAALVLAATPFLNAHAQKKKGEKDSPKEQIAALRAAVDTLSSQQAALEAGLAAAQTNITNLQTVANSLMSGSVAFTTDSGLNPIPVTQNTHVVNLLLPAGNYAVSGKVVAGDTSTTNVVVCALTNAGGDGPSTLDVSETPTLTAASFATLPLVGRVSVTGNATISIVCTAQNAGNAIGQFAHLNAIRVATLQ